MSEQPNSRKWWGDEVSKENAHEIVIPLVRTLDQQQSIRRQTDLLHMTLYAGMPITGLGPFAYSNVAMEDDGPRLNVCKAVTDAYVAMVTASRPKPQTLTNGGDWSLKALGRGLNKWLEGQWYETQLADDVGPACALDAGGVGTGIVKVYADVPGDDWKEATVALDRAFPWEITVDEAEAQDPRNIRNLFHSKWYDKDVLCEMFPAFKSQISDAPTNVDGQDGHWGRASGASLVRVTEAYHLPSSRLAKDGMRAVCIHGATLASVPFESQRFPFAFLRRAKAPMGLFGIGIPQELRGIQTTIHEILLAYEESMIYFARPKWFVPRSSKLHTGHLSDQIGEMVMYDGPAPPTPSVASAVMPSDVTALLWQLVSRAYAQVGVSEQAAQGEIPPGIKSGEGIRRANQVQAGRQAPASKHWEQWHVDIGNLMIEQGRIIAEKNPKFASVYQGKREREIVLFKSVDPGADKFTLRTFAVGGLSGTPAERLEELSDLKDKNVIDDIMFRELLDWPDLDGESDLVNAPYRIADKLIERFLYAEDPTADGVYIAPDPDWPLQWMRARMQLAACLADLDGAPEENVRLLRQFADACDVKLAPPPAPPAPPGAAAPPGAPPPNGAPPGPPGPPMVDQGAPPVGPPPTMIAA